MKDLVKVEIPSAYDSSDQSLESSTWKNGNLMVLRGKAQDLYYIGHETRTVIEYGGENGDEATEREAVFAFQIPVKKPASYGEVVNQAERTAYGLITDSQAISYTASLARKARENAEDEEVVEHDEFIAYVKSELACLFKPNN